MANWEVIKKVGVLSEKNNGYTVQVNVMSWYNRMPAVDIRKWNAEGQPTKGICLDKEELEILKKVINDITL